MPGLTFAPLIMEFDIFKLSNGLRVVHKPVKRPVAHLGLSIAAGSRDESPDEEGLAHFIEHCLFKGTQRRRAYHILSRMENVGGELNAYTSKEETVLYSSFLKEYYPRALELLTDVAFHSTFPLHECRKEQEVILDEINAYRDTPSERIFDEFEDQLFAEHPLGHNILGTPQSVRQLGPEKAQHFMHRLYGLNRMVVSSVGNISSSKLKQWLERYLGPHQAWAPERTNQLPPTLPQQKTEQHPGFQSHAILGFRAYPAYQAKSRVLMLLSNLLGGPGMNSRLNLNIREKYGFTYHLESFYQPYSDTGLFGIYLGTDPGTVNRALQLVQKELRRLREQKLGTLQLSKAKKQLLGQIAMARENNNALMLSYGKSLLTHNTIDTFADIAEKVEAITAEDLQEVAQEIMAPERQSQLIYQAQVPEHELL